MATKKGIIDYWLVSVYGRNHGFFDMKIMGTDANNKTEAKKQVKLQVRGISILDIIPIYRHEN